MSKINREEWNPDGLIWVVQKDIPGMTTELQLGYMVFKTSSLEVR